MQSIFPKERLTKSCTIISDSSNTIKQYCREEKLNHIAIKGISYKPDCRINTNALNGNVSMFRSWVFENFKSVSTKYLDNYLNYHTVLGILKGKTSKYKEAEASLRKSKKLWDYMLKNDNTMSYYRSIETEFQSLMEYHQESATSLLLKGRRERKAAKKLKKAALGQD